MLQTSLLVMKSLNKTESVLSFSICILFCVSKGNTLDFYWPTGLKFLIILYRLGTDERKWT